MDDLIKRQDAIVAVKIGAFSAATIYGRTDEGSTALHETVRAIKALPSAQPSVDEWCYDCKEYDADRHSCPRWNRVIRQTVEEAKIIHCKDCKHWTQSIGKMKGYGLGKCDFHDADLVTCNGFCYWAERRSE